jgi:uncharacterized protein (DUF302 family)
MGSATSAAGSSAIDLKRGLDRGLRAAIEAVRELSRPVQSHRERIQVATISAHNDSRIGQLVADALEKVGAEGAVTVEEAKGAKTDVEVVEGMQFDRGYLSPYFVTNPERMEVVLENAYLLWTINSLRGAEEIFTVPSRPDALRLCSFGTESSCERPMLPHATRYAISTTVPLSFEEALARTREALQSEGFGILTEIDVTATLRKKLNVEFRPYVILGACNPSLAYPALQAELDIGLLLPCNVVVYAMDDPARTVVAALDPIEALQISSNPAVLPIAEEVRSRLERVVASVGGG